MKSFSCPKEKNDEGKGLEADTTVVVAMKEGTGDCLVYRDKKQTQELLKNTFDFYKE